MLASEEFRRIFTENNLFQIYWDFISYKKSVGIDHINNLKFEKNIKTHIESICEKTLDGTYKFTKYKEKLISKGKNKYPRVLSLPTVRDKITHRALLELLIIFFDSYTHKFHNTIQNISKLYKDNLYDSVIRIDIENFYPSINHDILFKILNRNIRKKEINHLIRNAIAQHTVDHNHRKNNNYPIITQGIPQGLSISNILANIYMSPIDNIYSLNNGIFSYFRYVDDILILINEEDEKSIFTKICDDLECINLKIHPLGDSNSKTIISKTNDGFSYIGYVFKNGIISPGNVSIDRLRESIIKIFTLFKYTRNVLLFKWHLNLKITGFIFNGVKYGWIFYYSQINNETLLKSLDYFVEKQLTRFNIKFTGHQVKRFIRTYKEITKNLGSTKYIPNFDDYTIKMKQKILVEVSSTKKTFKNDEEIEIQFNEFIYKSIKDIERDLGRNY